MHGKFRVTSSFRRGVIGRMKLTDDIRLPFWREKLGEKHKLQATRGSGITATRMKKILIRLPIT